MDKVLIKVLIDKLLVTEKYEKFLLKVEEYDKQQLDRWEFVAKFLFDSMAHVSDVN